MKKIASLLAAVMLLTATLAGCGNSGSGSSTTRHQQRFFHRQPVLRCRGQLRRGGRDLQRGFRHRGRDYGEFTTIEEGKLIMSPNAQSLPTRWWPTAKALTAPGLKAST